MNNVQNVILEESMVQAIQGQQSYAYLLVNSSSGSCVGSQLIKPDNKRTKITTKNKKIITFFVFNLYDAKQREQAFQMAKQKSQMGKTVYIISCGGDGTVQWVIQQTIKSGINLKSIIFSVLPIGTGNDFAKSIGWGTFSFQINNKKFQVLAEQIQNCSLGFFDVWQISVEYFQGGSIIQIKNGTQVQRNQSKLVKNFTNYFGLGADAQVCYVAQKLRAKSILLKKIAYGFAGFLSFFIFCGGLKSQIKQFKQCLTEDNNIVQAQQLTQQQIKKPIDQQNLLRKIDLSNFDSCLTFLNTTSSMDLENVWQTPYINSQKNRKQFQKQKVSDGLIQIVSYTNQVSLWFERVFHMAKKVSQGNGPYVINFKQPKKNQSTTAYIHINGEPYKIKNARSITISPSSQFPSGKIKVLYRTKN